MKLYMQALLEEEGRWIWASLPVPIAPFREGQDFEETRAIVSALMFEVDSCLRNALQWRDPKDVTGQ